MSEMNIVDMDAFNYAINKLTDFSTKAGDAGYKLVNLHVSACYVGLRGLSSRLALCAFNFLLRSKFYGKDANSRKEFINEEKRIYTDLPITLEDILCELDNAKYSNKKAVAMAASNMNKSINELDDDNIFYSWRYNGFYMFVMERDVRMWKPYNPTAHLIPKTLKKVVAISEDMLYCMTNNIENKYKTVDKSDLEASFGHFINKLIDKMNPFVAGELTKWNGKENVSRYLTVLSQQLEVIPDEDGIIITSDIFKALPRSVSEKLFKNMNEEVAMKTKQAQNSVPTNVVSEVTVDQNAMVENDIIPANPNLVKPQRAKRTRSSLPSEKAQLYTYDGVVAPFENSLHFVAYYKAFLYNNNKDTRFDAIDNDALYAGQVLDLLRDKEHYGDKGFLNGWLRFFCDTRLKGEKVLKTKYTSIKTFKETIDDFIKNSYMSPANLV